MEDLQREFMSEVQRRGMAARVVSVHRLPELMGDIQGPKEDGLFDTAFYQIALSHFEFSIPAELPNATHIVVLAHPEPVTVAEFHWAGKANQVIIPPIYLPAQAKANQQALRALLEGQGYQTAGAKLPLKALAVHSGLGEYGRNNICYVHRMGSFVRLDAFYTDAPLVEDDWGEKRLMEACANCCACEVSCPTASLAPDRFIIRAERCLTYMNELEGDFPNWVQPAWHNALIGCMRCQTVCPQNAPFINHPVGSESFTEDETAVILAATTFDQLGSESCSKLRRLEWGESGFPLLKRNLCVLLQRT